MKVLKVGIIGCGGIANGKHIAAIKKAENIDIIAFCDLIEEKAIASKEGYGSKTANIYTDYKKMIENEKDIEAIYVLTPNRSHSTISVDALNAGKHVLCEKPMAINTEEAQKMLDAAKKNNCVLTVGYQNRYRSDAEFLKSACVADELGEIYYAKAHAVRRRAVPTWGVFLNEYEQGGGPLIDIGTHALDITLWMMDNYDVASVTGSVYKKLGDQTNTGNAWGDWDPEKFTVEDSAFGFIKMKNGATIHLESSWALNTLDVDEAKTTLCGTKGGADMKGGIRINKVKHNKQCIEIPGLDAGGVAFYDGDTKDAPDIEQETFYNAIVNGAEVVVKPEQALVVTQVLEAIYKSAETGKTIYFGEEQ